MGKYVTYVVLINFTLLTKILTVLRAIFTVVLLKCDFTSNRGICSPLYLSFYISWILLSRLPLQMTYTLGDFYATCLAVA